ncbi:ABC transporter ATP-binding protein [Lacticaseibacillus nasuensis]|uniref:ABC transporter ATP-binding protein n=1 Tax=Lacticaseibacillus nasuensis TaxID=944671 RepID=UPI000704C5CB|nr:ATP-binding cassette domain-containing protein [Lacticaseibacillus nasuensis]
MPSPLLTLSAVGYTPHATPILTDISFTVMPGEFVTIAGPSGSGKSTLLRLIATLLTPTTGTITYAGRPQSSYEKTAYRREVSYCFQQPSLFGRTVQDNLTFPYTIRQQPADPERLTAALATMSLPAAMLTKPITELSGGEKQRIALLRNLLFEPKLLLLDEVTTGLDAVTKDTVHQVIAEANARGVTVLSVTHDDRELAQATRTITIAAGRQEVSA